MKALLAPAIIATSLFANTPAVAAELYAGFQFASLKSSVNDTTINNVNPTLVIGRFDYPLSNYFSVEARLGTGLQDQNINSGNTTDAYSVDSLIGAYLLAHIDFGSIVSVYGLAGYTQIKGAQAAGSPVTFTTRDSASDSTFGFGTEIGKDGTTFTLEYAKYYNEKGVSLNAISAGLRFAL